MSFLYKNKQFLQFNHNANNLTETQANTRSHSINLSNITAKKTKKHTANKKTRFRDKHPTPQKQPTKPHIFNLTNLKNCLFTTLYKQHKTSKEATLFARIRKRVPKIDKNVNTRIVIDRNVWERANKDASSLEKFYRTKDGQTIYRKMCAIDQRLVDKFLFMLEKEDYMPKSINKYLVCFRAMVGCAHKARFHNNSVAEKCFSKIRVRECDKAKKIYLNDTELQALYEMPLEGLDAQVRDAFLVGCYTCQRYSDYSALTANNFTTTARGNKVVRLIHFLR